MVLEYILPVLGIIMLIKGADLLVEGASSLGRKLGVSTIVLGLTVVALGTSIPELVVNLFAVTSGVTDIALGNIIGSNLSNILLVLGISAAIYGLKIKKSTTWNEIPFSLLAAVVLFVVISDVLINNVGFSFITRGEGMVMLAFFIIFLYYAYGVAKTEREYFRKEGLRFEGRSYFEIFIMFIVSMVILFLGGRWTVEGVIFFANMFDISQFLISAIGVAIGTSLPELVTSLVALKKGKVDLAVGNVVGSNIFNIFFVLAISSLIVPISVGRLVSIDVLFLVFVSVLLFLFMFIGRKHFLKRWQGVFFIGLYGLYVLFSVYRG